MENRFVLIDPRTATPGLAFLAFTREILGDAGFAPFWRELKNQWFQLSPSWDLAYQIFSRGQTTAVWSYVTSQAYHQKKGEKNRRALFFKEGQPTQVEGAIFIKRSNETLPKPCAIAFVDFMLSDLGQRTLSERNWMMPVLDSVLPQLPPHFQNLPKPDREWVLKLTAADSLALIKKWKDALAR